MPKKKEETTNLTGIETASGHKGEEGVEGIPEEKEKIAIDYFNLIEKLIQICINFNVNGMYLQNMISFSVMTTVSIFLYSDAKSLNQPVQSIDINRCQTC